MDVSRVADLEALTARQRRRLEEAVLGGWRKLYVEVGGEWLRVEELMFQDAGPIFLIPARDAGEAERIAGVVRRMGGDAEVVEGIASGEPRVEARLPPDTPLRVEKR